MLDADCAEELRLRLRQDGLGTEVLSGVEALEKVASLPQVDSVMAAIVGAAGLHPSLAAARAGKRVLLANKETLVMSGALFMDTVHRHGAELLPIDSEHNAIFQSLPRGFSSDLSENGVRRILLTASGGPFRNTPLSDLERVTPEQACAHPNWVMGKKISVDSSTMMNKGLEVSRGALAVQHRVRADRGGHSSTERDSFHGGIRRWIGAGATRQSGHAHAHRLCLVLSRTH